MGLITCTCDACGATLSVDTQKRQAFCEYCGARLLIHNENEVIHRHIDEAKMRELDLLEQAQKAALARQEQAQGGQPPQRGSRVIAWPLLVACLLAALGLAGVIAGIPPLMAALPAGLLVWGAGKVAGIDRAARHKGMARFAVRTSNRNCHTVKAALEHAGFTDVTLTNMRDLRAGVLYKPDCVSSVTVDGHRPAFGAWYRQDAKISILHHGYRDA